MSPRYEFDRTWEFAVTPEDFWATISRVGDFPNWWPWLREFDGTKLAEGTRVSCTVKPPLPYGLHFQIDVENIVPISLIETAVSGDISGPARLEVAPRGSGCVARLVWSLEVHDPLLSAAGWIARPVLEWSHDWVVRHGVRQFRSRALL